MKSDALPRVALVGIPNVGKSSLLNRLIGSRAVIVHNESHTTRDTTVHQARWHDRALEVQDTPGFTSSPETGIATEAQHQLQAALVAADAVVFVVDITMPTVTEAERRLARIVRQSHKPVILVYNQADRKHDSLQHFRALGFEHAIAVSAHHATGIAELQDELLKLLPITSDTLQKVPAIHVALLGRPNVGKSSLLNAFAQQTTAIVSAEAGTTRDPVSATIIDKGQRIEITDTAGLRRPGRIGTGIEYFSLTRTRQVIGAADICVLVLDATEAATAMDQRIAGIVRDAGKGLILAINKADQLDGEERNQVRLDRRLNREFEFVWWAPYVLISANTGQHLEELMAQIHAVYERIRQPLPTREVNKVLSAAVTARPPASSERFRPKLNYATQTNQLPLEITMFGSHPEAIHFSYRRYLENRLREAFDLRGVPVRLIFKSKYQTKDNEKDTAQA